MDSGFAVVISFASNPTIKLYQKDVTPPGIDGGGVIDTTTKENTTWRTAYVKALMSMTEGSLTAAYDPAVYSEIIAMINVNQLITVTFPDAATVVFYGALTTFEPSSTSQEDDEQPTADCTISPTLQDATGAETAPVIG
jgi:hypothetical protein